jgi:serine/threonine protein kinase/tetratricopeptide (TPR) repeat protein
MSSISGDPSAWDNSTRDLLADWSPESEPDGLCSFRSPDSPPCTHDSDPLPDGPPWETPAKFDSFPSGPTRLYEAFDPGSSTSAKLGFDTGDFSSSTNFQMHDAPTRRKSADVPQKQQADAGTKIPRVGDLVGGFRLKVELGRGAFARVFLAEEVSLGHRPVALKVSRAEGDEPKLLARLQHAHIVPVHSVHDDPATGLRLLCMPFFGGANLAQLLQETWGLTHSQLTGRSIVEALDQFSQRLPHLDGEAASVPVRRAHRSAAKSRPRSALALTFEPADTPPGESRSLPQNSSASIWRLRSLVNRLVPHSAPFRAHPDDRDEGLPSRQFLRGANGIQAAVWIVARLAEGLDHAHCRGLVHRDLKPANILVAADGTPMLLDFNLAAETEPQLDPGEEISKAMLGGTFPYMAPEHLDAFDPQGSTAAGDVDERSDLYALGLVLFEMIAGNAAFPDPPEGLSPAETIRFMVAARRRTPVPSLRSVCPEVPWSLDALVAQCLDPEPDRRFASARDLAEDLRRFLDDMPMKHCPEPSLRERLGKWARRHPGLCGSTSIALAAVVLLGLVGGFGVLAYEATQSLAARMRLQELDRDFMEAQFLLGLGEGHDDLKRRGIGLARKTLEQVGLGHRASSRQTLSRHQADAGRDLAGGWLGRLAPDERERVRRQVVELMLQSARASVDLQRKGAEPDRRAGLERAVSQLDQAELIQPAPTRALYNERARYYADLGDADLAARDRDRAAKLAPASSQDFTMLAKLFLADRNFAGAEVALREAIKRDVSSFWAWYHLGHCHFEQGRYLEAAGDFNACFLGGLKFPWVHFNRGLALAKAGSLLDAKTSYDQALALDRDFVLARFNRGLVELELNDLDQALIDLRAAVDHGCREVGVMAALAENLVKVGRPIEADQIFNDLLRQNPHDPIVRVARGMACVRTDPERAKQDFTAVLQDDPRSAMAHYGMARVVRAVDHHQALKHLGAALDANPYLIDALELRALERARVADPAALDDVNLLVKTPTARRLYNASCALAVYAETAHDPRPLDRATQLLAQALAGGFSPLEAAQDPDLKLLRNRPDVVALLARYAARVKPSSR